MKSFLAAAVFWVAAGARAGEWSVQYLPQVRTEYEGTGFRQVPNGWELKVKPWTPAGGLRWQQPLAPKLSLQAQYWVNRSAYFKEDGNTQLGPLRQTGLTRQSIQSLWVDVRRPLAGSAVEAVGGVHGVYQSFRRKDIVFNGAADPSSTLDTQSGLGAHLGVHFGRLLPPEERRGYFWDGELLLGRLLWTRNNRRTEGGGIHSGGYTYSFRLEAGRAVGPLRLSLGYARQMYEILVPGGRALPSGAAGSLPINKTDFFGPYLSVGWAYR
ncbi:MAG: hypothetical protein IPP68_02520 [Elusimicrobia bacterium]|nr:hypothetical protein [Elusimicrobiota bacterium]